MRFHNWLLRLTHMVIKVSVANTNKFMSRYHTQATHSYTTKEKCVVRVRSDVATVCVFGVKIRN